MDDDNRGWLIVLIIVALLMFSDGGGGVLPSTDPTAVVYVYEKDQAAIPSAVQSGLNRLNREKKIVATIFDRDTVDGNGEVPDQYKVPLAAAVDKGVPSLVVMSGSDVRRVVKDPKTEEEVMEAAK